MATTFTFDEIVTRLVSTPTASAGYAARTLRPDEPLPSWVEGASVAKLDHDWVWVVDGPDGIQAVLIAAGGHGLVYVLRVQSAPKAHPHLLVPLLRKALADWAGRGYKGYVTILDPESPVEERLMRVIYRAGGGLQGKGLVFAGLIDEARRY